MDKFVNARAHLGKKTIANHLTLLITMLGLAKDLGWIADVPRIRKPRINISQAYSYLRTSDEIGRFLRAAESEGEMIRTLYAAAVFTGIREGELAWRRLETALSDAWRKSSPPSPQENR